MSATQVCHVCHSVHSFGKLQTFSLIPAVHTSLEKSRKARCFSRRVQAEVGFLFQRHGGAVAGALPLRGRAEAQAARDARCGADVPCRWRSSAGCDTCSAFQFTT